MTKGSLRILRRPSQTFMAKPKRIPTISTIRSTTTNTKSKMPQLLQPTMAPTTRIDLPTRVGTQVLYQNSKTYQQAESNSKTP
jgi:hypothetical protein